jgi:hypothetical protein
MKRNRVKVSSNETHVELTADSVYELVRSVRFIRIGIVAARGF